MASVTPEISATISNGGTWGIGFDYTIGAKWFQINHLYGYRSNYLSGGNGTLTIQVYDANGTLLNTQSDYITLWFTKGGYDSESLSYWKFNSTTTNCGHTAVSGITTKTITVKISTTSDAFNDYIKSKTWTYTITMPLYTNTIAHWAGGFKNSEGNNGAKTMFNLGYTYFDAWVDSSVLYDTSRGMTIPKGFGLSSGIGSSSWTGSWQSWTMPVYLTQPWGGTHVQYSYYPWDYSISYVLNGGTNNSSNPSSYNVLYQAQLYSPTRTGYRFNHWDIGFLKGTISHTASTGGYNYKRLYHEVKPGQTYTISIDKASITAGSATSFTILIYDFTIPAQLAAVTGKFGGSQKLNITCPSSATETNDIDIIIYAGIAGSTENNATTYTNVKVQTNTNYINQGANATFSSASDLYSKLSLRNIGNTEAIANWNANVYTIQYNANGGAGAPGNSSKTYDTQLLIPSAEPTRDGYEFLGWSTSSTATSASYIPGTYLTTDLSTTHGATVVLYAVWRELKVYVNVGGVWVEGSPYINIDGEWKRIVCVYVNNNGTWRPMG